MVKLSSPMHKHVFFPNQLHFPKHGALSTHLLPLYNEVATAINGEDGVVGVDAPLSVNDDDENFTVTLRAMNGRHFGSACGKVSIPVALENVVPCIAIVI